MPPIRYGEKPFGQRLDPYSNGRGAHFWEYDQNQKPDEHQKSPLIKPVDLYHLRLSVLAGSLSSLEKVKNWFFDGLLPQHDLRRIRQSIDLTADELQAIQSEIKIINNTLMGDANIDETDLYLLKNQLLALFEHEEWMNIARAMVHSSALHIDTLNTLVLWQAGKLASNDNNPEAFSLRIINAEHPLITNTKKNYIPGNNVKRLIDHLAVYSYMNDKININVMRFRQDAGSGESLCAIASTPLFENYLVEEEQCYLLPLYAGGLYYGEDFTAATYLHARLMQLCFPKVQSNLFYVHGLFQGEVSTQHDWEHTGVDYPELSEDGREAFEKRMEMIAIIGNVWARMSDTSPNEKEKEYFSLMAHGWLDNPSENAIKFEFSAAFNASRRPDYINENKIFFAYLFAEIIYTQTGVYPAIASIQVNCDNSGKEQCYSAEITLPIFSKTIAMEVNIKNGIKTKTCLDELNTQLEKVNNLSCATGQPVLLKKTFTDPVEPEQKPNFGNKI